MECNRDEALRAKEIAERKASGKDYVCARKFALKAQNLFPSLEGISQMIATLDVYLASEAKINGEKDLYAILHINSSADEEAVKKQYRKLALLLHPDKNKLAGAEGAFQLVSEAWNVLSDRSKKMVYDQRISLKRFEQRASQPNKPTSAPKASRNGFHQFADNCATKARDQQSIPQRPPSTISTPSYMHPSTFWTSCAGCCMQYEYHRMYLNKSLLCPKCKQPFVATELSAPPSGLRPPEWPPKQHDLNDKRDNANKNASPLVGLGVPGFEHREPGNSSCGTKFQRSSFPGVAASADADNSSATVEQVVNVAKQAFEKAKKPGEDAQATIRREAILRKRFNVSRKNSNVSANLNIGNDADIHVNRRTGIGGNSGSNCVRNQIDPTVGATTNTFSNCHNVGIPGDPKDRFCARQTTFNKEILQVDARPLLIEKAKYRIFKKIGEFKSAEAAKDMDQSRVKKKQKPKKESVKDIKEFDENHLKDRVKGKSAAKETPDESRRNKKVLQEEVRQDDDGESDLDDKINQPVSIDVPDPDFHDFDIDRMEEAFSGDQIWATYDDDDGMPRYYALIQKVLSTNPFKVRMGFLTSKSSDEFTQLDWVGNGFSKTCGNFRVGRYEVFDSINIFSHRVKWDKGLRGVIKVLPKRGDTWALYRNWSPHWDDHTSDDVIHKYDMVEVLDDYNEDHGVSIVSLVKIAGFKTVFQRLDPKEAKKIPKQEMFRFSHQVPCYVLTGDEADNAPKGCLELDPAATPLELLRAPIDAKSDDQMIESEQ